ncbi:MAG TPA: xanthine dehydrogenase family protein subunit M, partial [Thermomicrobiales bacterium]|nr:xanthine dehydrogenase family protein subunit M [Thermomicrobiales bacterium]
MFPAPFNYSRASSVADAVAMLQENPDAKILAGGHSLIPAMKLRLAMPGSLVDLRDIAELRGIDVGGDAVTIRAMTTYNEIRDNDEVVSALPILAEAIGVIGDAQVREHGTLVGALVHNDPAADLTAVVLALGGSVHAVGPNGERDVSLDEFFVDLWTTTLEPEEVVTHVTLNRHDGGRMTYRKFAHPASGYAVVGVATVLDMDGDEVASARVAITGASNTATRLAAVEQAIAGKTLDEESVAAALAYATDGVVVNGDEFASEAYRTHLVRVLTKRALLGTQV